MADERELFFTEIRELRKEMNTGFDKMCDALSVHKKETNDCLKVHEDKISTLSRQRDFVIGGGKLIAIIASIVIFLKQIIS